MLIFSVVLMLEPYQNTCGDSCLVYSSQIEEKEWIMRAKICTWHTISHKFVITGLNLAAEVKEWQNSKGNSMLIARDHIRKKDEGWHGTGHRFSLEFLGEKPIVKGYENTVQKEWKMNTKLLCIRYN